MALEPRSVTLDDENPELKDMTRRFWISTALTVPLVIFAMLRHLPGIDFLPHGLMTWASWIEFVLATPVVLWGGWPFFERAWASLVNRHLNMFALRPGRVGSVPLQRRRHALPQSLSILLP